MPRDHVQRSESVPLADAFPPSLPLPPPRGFSRRELWPQRDKGAQGAQGEMRRPRPEGYRTSGLFVPHRRRSRANPRHPLAERNIPSRR